MSRFQIYEGSSVPHDVTPWPTAPPWRRFEGKAIPRTLAMETEARGATFQARKELVELVNAAIHLRRPLLVTGKPGTGKSSLAYAVAYELKLGRVLEWQINSRSTRQEGLYHYDAIGRLQVASLAQHGDKTTSVGIGDYIRLGPLGTALLPADRPRVLLIDEIDKSDVDLPNDLLHVFEEGWFDISELVRSQERTVSVRPARGDGDDLIPIEQGHVSCREFPVVILTSNGEREFPAAFKRRCIRIEMPNPTPEELSRIVSAHLGSQEEVLKYAKPLIDAFVAKQREGDMATDQLLNAIRLAMGGADLADGSNLSKAVLRPLSAV